MPPSSCSALAELGGELGLGAGRLPHSGVKETWSAAQIPRGAGLGALPPTSLPLLGCTGAGKEDGVERWLLSRGASAQRAWAGDCSLVPKQGLLVAFCSNNKYATGSSNQTFPFWKGLQLETRWQSCLWSSKVSSPSAPLLSLVLPHLSPGGAACASRDLGVMGQWLGSMPGPGASAFPAPLRQVSPRPSTAEGSEGWARRLCRSYLPW